MKTDPIAILFILAKEKVDFVIVKQKSRLIKIRQFEALKHLKA